MITLMIGEINKFTYGAMFAGMVLALLDDILVLWRIKDDDS